MAEPTDRGWRAFSKIPKYKIDQTAYLFVRGMPIIAASFAVSLSLKTVRQLYGHFREYLEYEEFAPAIRIEQIATVDKTPSQMRAWIDEFYEVAGACHAAQSCHRNYELGNRQNRECRSCPFRKWDQRIISIERFFDDIDRTRAFYRYLGWRDAAKDSVGMVFKRRYLHYQISRAAWENTLNMWPNAHRRYEAFLSVHGLHSMLLFYVHRLAPRPRTRPPRIGRGVRDRIRRRRI